jgi:hypothetical protein
VPRRPRRDAPGVSFCTAARLPTGTVIRAPMMVGFSRVCHQCPNGDTLVTDSERHRLLRWPTSIVARPVVAQVLARRFRLRCVRDEEAAG